MASRWYCTIESVKAASIGTFTPELDDAIGSYIAAASERVEHEFGRRFIPETATKYFPCAEPSVKDGVLYLDSEDLLAVTQLLSRAQDTPYEIVAGNYFVEPVNDPPYNRIELKEAAGVTFDGGTASQRAIAVTGRWGYCETTRAAGTLVGALDLTATEVVLSDGLLVGVGDTLLIDAEQVFIKARTTVPNRVTVQRNVNGTGAATHSNGAAVLAYVPPADISDLVRVTALQRPQQGRAGWTGQIGGDEDTQELRTENIGRMWSEARSKYARLVVA